MNNKILLNTAIILIGLVFLASGIAKGIDIQGFAEILREFGSDTLYFLAPFISAVEIFLGFSLLLFISPKKLSFLSLVITIFFTIILILVNIFFGIEDCGCFGSIIKIPLYISYIRNIILIGLSYYVWRYYPYTSNATTKWIRIRFGIAITFAIVSFAISTLEVTSTYRQAHKIHNVNIYSTFLPSIIKIPQNKRYLIFVFLPTCSHCQKAVVKIKEFKKKGLIENIVGLYPSYVKNKDLTFFTKEFQVDFPIKPCRYDSLQAITKSKIYPTILYVKGDTIVSSFTGYVPSLAEWE